MEKQNMFLKLLGNMFASWELFPKLDKQRNIQKNLKILKCFLICLRLLPLNKHIYDGTCSWPTIARAGITGGETNDNLSLLRPDSTTATFVARKCVCEIRMVAHFERFYWIFPQNRLPLTGEAKFFLKKLNLSWLRMHLIDFARNFSNFAEENTRGNRP